jgi:hypothetical protein
MGRRPEGDQALSGAERQARYRARHAAAAAAAVPQWRPSKTRPPSRVQRWAAAVEELLRLQAEYASWLEALPEAARDGAMGEALQAVVDLDLTEIATIQLPRGFGRD